MKFNIVSGILFGFALLGIGVMVFMATSNKPGLNYLVYTVVFVLVPLLAAYGIWRRKIWGICLAIVLFLPLSVRVIGGATWIPFNPPISFGVPVGSFENGSGYLIDFFAIILVVFSLMLLQNLISTKIKVESSES